MSFWFLRTTCPVSEVACALETAGLKTATVFGPAGSSVGCVISFRDQSECRLLLELLKRDFSWRKHNQEAKFPEAFITAPDAVVGGIRSGTQLYKVAFARQLATRQFTTFVVAKEHLEEAEKIAQQNLATLLQARDGRVLLCVVIDRISKVKDALRKLPHEELALFPTRISLAFGEVDKASRVKGLVKYIQYL